MKTLALIMLVAVAGVVYAGTPPIKDGTLSARSDGNNVIVEWGTTDESGVKEFGIERCTASGSNFVLIGRVSPKGSNSYYQYVDQTAYKTTGSIYKYRIVDAVTGAVYSDKPVTVSHDVSGVKHTWGSLKAMFR